MMCIVEHMVESNREASSYMTDGQTKSLYVSLGSIAMAILQLTRVEKWSFPVSEDKIHDERFREVVVVQSTAGTHVVVRRHL